MTLLGGMALLVFTALQRTNRDCIKWLGGFDLQPQAEIGEQLEALENGGPRP